MTDLRLVEQRAEQRDADLVIARRLDEFGAVLRAAAAHGVDVADLTVNSYRARGVQAHIDGPPALGVAILETLGVAEPRTGGGSTYQTVSGTTTVAGERLEVELFVKSVVTCASCGAEQ